ncbi:MAG TPA: lytic murein transglycosylase B [Thiothrix sp.]|nr:lytic murein transglycosylase B [Thiothrix sp.]
MPRKSIGFFKRHQWFMYSAILTGMVFSLVGCDTIPVLDTSKLPSTPPWQQPLPPTPRATPTSSPAPAPTTIPAPVQPTIISQPVPAPTAPAPAMPQTRGPYLNYPEMRQFIAEMSRKHGFNRNTLEKIFSTVPRGNEVLAKVKAPAEAKPWRSYRPIFLTEDRIRGGVDFWRKNRASLDNAARQFGVDPAYIVAIIGVETAYGRNVGKYNVLQSLTTLAFDYPARQDFYRKELEQFLLLTREENINPHRLVGSYAGAMGISQFISSSYRHYAVDFNNDRRRDLWRAADAIGSVANYFKKHKWKRGGDVAVPAQVSGYRFESMADTKAKAPRYTLDQLRNAGVRPLGRFWSAKVSLIKLVGTRDTEYWIGGENFYTITRYNHSPTYARAVHQLAQAIRSRV